jgi:hypothetical protein
LIHLSGKQERQMAEQKLDISQETIAKLAEMRTRQKYLGMPGTMYNGMRPEGMRLRAEAQINALIDRLQSGLPLDPSKKFVLTEFERAMADQDQLMNEFRSADTEDREQFMTYLQDIMDIVGIASSDGLLNRWMYGTELAAMIEKVYPQGEAS